MSRFAVFERETVFQHAAARRRLGLKPFIFCPLLDVSTRSRPKAAGFYFIRRFIFRRVFQHAAARRRLAPLISKIININNVSTRSRPKAAGIVVLYKTAFILVSTRSRPKAAGRIVKERSSIP